MNVDTVVSYFVLFLLCWLTPIYQIVSSIVSEIKILLIEQILDHFVCHSVYSSIHFWNRHDWYTHSSAVSDLPLLYSEAYKIDCAIVISSVFPSSGDFVPESESTAPTKPMAAKKNKTQKGVLIHL
jgi:hypothetical protein